MKNKILIVEDEKPIAELLEYGLTKQGFETESCRLLSDARKIVKHDRPDLVLLDLSLPDGDGLDFCRKIAPRMNMPIIILTARASQSDKLLGLEYGADDYITKPFDMQGVVLRIKSVLRRMEMAAPPTLESEPPFSVAGIRFVPSTQKVYFNNEELSLTPKEYALLYFLAKNTGTIVSRADIMDHVWGLRNYVGDTRTVDIHIQRLRRKLGRSKIRTAFGAGYVLEENE